MNSLVTLGILVLVNYCDIVSSAGTSSLCNKEFDGNEDLYNLYDDTPPAQLRIGTVSLVKKDGDIQVIVNGRSVEYDEVYTEMGIIEIVQFLIRKKLTLLMDSNLQINKTRAQELKIDYFDREGSIKSMTVKSRQNVIQITQGIKSIILNYTNRDPTQLKSRYIYKISDIERIPKLEHNFVFTYPCGLKNVEDVKNIKV